MTEDDLTATLPRPTTRSGREMLLVYRSSWSGPLISRVSFSFSVFVLFSPSVSRSRSSVCPSRCSPQSARLVYTSAGEVLSSSRLFIYLDLPPYIFLSLYQYSRSTSFVLLPFHPPVETVTPSHGDRTRPNGSLSSCKNVSRCVTFPELEASSARSAEKSASIRNFDASSRPSFLRLLRRPARPSWHRSEENKQRC